MFSFQEASILFSIVVVPAYIPTSSECMRAFFSTFSPTFVCGGLDGSYSYRSEVKTYCGLALNFLYSQGW
jgi:hypothetical protein